MSETPKLDPEQELILRECLRRQLKIKATPTPPIWKYWDIQALEELRLYGPKYQPGEWFGKLLEHIRQRRRRAILALESEGLLAIHRPMNKRLSNIKLTDAGMRIAESLPDDEPSDDAETPRAA